MRKREDLTVEYKSNVMKGELRLEELRTEDCQRLRSGVPGVRGYACMCFAISP